MIKLKNISKRYGEREVLKNIDYTFKNGKIYVLKGFSGCGKTTLLNILAGIDLSFNGEYLHDGKKVSNIRNITNIGYIMQFSLLVLKLTIMENLKLVSSDEKKILYYANLFQVTEILNKYPNEVSGGERQRITIIRALLKSNDIILADEPTASLDLKNAKIVAKEFEKLKSFNKIVIIATHENCFDEIADEIINLNYGEIDNIIYRKNETKKRIIPNFVSNKEDFRKIDFKYIKIKLQNHNSKRFIIISSLLLAIFFLLIGFKSNFKKEYLKFLKNKYPINTFYIDEKLYEDIKDLSEFTIYENYSYKSENDLNFLPLPYKNDSIFLNDDYILFGNFPTSNDEIMINKNAYKKLFNDSNYKDGINKKIEVDGMNFIISGIITDDESHLSTINSSNPFYNIDNSNSFVLVPYQNIVKFGNIEERSFLLMSSKDLYRDEELLYSLKNKEIFIYWDDFVETYSENLNFIFNILIIVLIFISILLFLFVNNEISFKLYFRKKEIGYFQIFNISKKRILKNIVLEYYIQFLKILFYSIIILFIISIIIFLFTNFYIIPKIHSIIIYSIVFLVYTFILIFVPVNKFLKEKIIKLINE